MKKLLMFLSMGALLFAKSDKLIIDAQKFEVNDKKGITKFEGNVKIQMSKDKLNANKVIIFFKKNTKQPYKYEATGKVSFEIVTRNKHYMGKGNKIIYSPLKEEYTVMGNGFLQEKNNSNKIYGDKIYVNQLTGEARVSGSEKKPVRFILDIQRGEGK